MKITVVNEDKVIIVDGQALNVDFSISDSIWAIHWDSEKESGWIEYAGSKLNEKISDFSDYSYLVDLHASRLAEIEQNDADLKESIAKDPKNIKNLALSDITYIRADGIEIQVRHPKFAPDIELMKDVIKEMSDEEKRSWISKQNKSIKVSKQDLEEAIKFGSSEIRRINEEYIAKLKTD